MEISRTRGEIQWADQRFLDLFPFQSRTTLDWHRLQVPIHICSTRSCFWRIGNIHRSSDRISCYLYLRNPRSPYYGLQIESVRHEESSNQQYRLHPNKMMKRRENDHLYLTLLITNSEGQMINQPHCGCTLSIPSLSLHFPIHTSIVDPMISYSSLFLGESWWYISLSFLPIQ